MALFPGGMGQIPYADPLPTWYIHKDGVHYITIVNYELTFHTADLTKSALAYLHVAKETFGYTKYKKDDSYVKYIGPLCFYFVNNQIKNVEIYDLADKKNDSELMNLIEIMKRVLKFSAFT